MRLLLATDAWHPQVNGVVRSLTETARELGRTGTEVAFLTPDDFRTVPLPTYPEIRVALATARRAADTIRRVRPDAVHIATEGPIGLATRRACLRAGIAFTTSYHTRFPDYLHARTGVPAGWTHAWLRRFHNAAAVTMVPTESLRAELAERGFQRLVRWTRGVDTEQFRPGEAPAREHPGPVFLYVGRLAVEKNVRAFLALDLPGTKLVVGDGPQRRELEASFPDAVFTGTRTGRELARTYASADVFVFPSLTDTFGLVLLEALACGVPVAAFPTPGPADLIGAGGPGVLDADLARAALAALSIPRAECRAFALRHSWEAAARDFAAHLVPVGGPGRFRAPAAASNLACPPPIDAVRPAG